MKEKKLRFKEIIDALPKLNTRILSQRLTEMEQEGLIVRSVTQTKPITISYEISRKGLALQEVFEHYADWVKTWGIATRCRKCYSTPLP